MVELIEKPNGLLIRLTDKEELKDLFWKQKHENILIGAYDILDRSRYLGNGWDEIMPDKIGALTDSPIIAKDTYYDDDGNLELPEGCKIYWYPNYMIKDPWKVLLKKGEVFFDLAE